jgi:Zn-dependent M28 family amino/carboxypeptidase
LILELFLAMSKYRTKNKVRFAWWGAEENGLLGSRHYCSTIGSSDANKILAYLNFDMVARGYIGVSDGDGSSHGSVAPPGSDVIQRIYVEHFQRQGIAVTPAILTNGSDYASFWGLLNKPFGFLHTGTGVAQDPCYHQACDTIKNPDPQTLTTNARVCCSAPVIPEMETDCSPRPLRICSACSP